MQLLAVASSSLSSILANEAFSRLGIKEATYVPLQVVSSRPSSCFSLLPSSERTVFIVSCSPLDEPSPPAVYLTSGLRTGVLPLSNSRRLCRAKRTDSFLCSFVFSTRSFSTCDLSAQQEGDMKSSWWHISLQFQVNRSLFGAFIAFRIGCFMGMPDLHYPATTGSRTGQTSYETRYAALWL